ncbi:MAG: PQQ-binding-like beta-propeller repeat protein [Bacteroidetes bacterium]|nr:PQQ-binding-like beta-propeller repeat protein [Bacteroidota bacterium]
MRKLSFVLALLCICSGLMAQKNTDWTKNFPSKINWYKISDAGTLVVATKDGLYGISPVDGSEVWKNDDIENIQESNYDPIEGTPYAALSKAGLTKSVNNIVDLVTGKIVANTKDLGLRTVSKRIYLMKSNKVLFYGGSDKGAMLLVLADLSTGQKVWEQEKIFSKNSEQIVSQAGETADAIFIATNKNIYKLKKETGEVVYNISMKSDLPMAPPEEEKGGGFGKMFSMGKTMDKAAGQMTTLTSAEFFQHTDPNTIYFWNQDILTAFNTADGKEIWKRVELPSPIANILFDDRGMLVATAEKTQEDIQKASEKGHGLIGKIKRSGAGKKNRATLLCLDMASGAAKWNSDIELQGDVVAYKLSGTKLILGTARDQGTNFISIVDLDAGKSITQKPLSIKGTVTDLQIVPQGLYFRTTDQINILDLGTGDKTWKKGFTVNNCSGQNADIKTGYVYANGTVYKVDFEKGDLTEWVTGIRFDNKEEPTSLQLRENGVLLTSDQNARLYDYNGKQVFHTYEQPPGRTLAGKLTSGLGALTSAAISAQQMAQSAQMSYAKGYYGSTSSSLDNSIKNSSTNASNFGGAAVESFKSISKRFSATKQANNFIAILTNFGGGNTAKEAGVMMIDKSNGKEIRKIILGDKKDPDYKLDELGRVVYYKANGSEISGFRF